MNLLVENPLAMPPLVLLRCFLVRGLLNKKSFRVRNFARLPLQKKSPAEAGDNNSLLRFRASMHHAFRLGPLKG